MLPSVTGTLAQTFSYEASTEVVVSAGNTPAQARARWATQAHRAWERTHSRMTIKKDKEGLPRARDWLRKLFYEAPAASPGEPQKTSRATSDAHVPGLSRPADVSLVRKGGGQFCKSHCRL